MSINSAPINTFPINAPAAAPAAPVVQVPLTLANAINSPPLAVLPVPLNLANAIPPTTDAGFLWALPLRIDAGFVWDLVLRVGALATYPLGWAADMVITYPLQLLAKVDAGFEWPLPMLDVDPVNREIEFPYSLRLNREFELSAELLEVVNREIELSAGLLDAVNREFELSAELLAFDKVNRQIRYVYSLLDESAVNVTGAIELELVKTNEIIPITSGTVETSEDSYTWIATIDLADIRDFDKFDFDDALIVRIYGEEYNLLVDGKDRSRSGPADVSARLRAISTTARAATPRAAELTETFGQILAQDAVEQILGQLVDWQIIDWLIPAGRLAAENADPIEIAQQIVEAAGATIETNPDGTFYVRDRYPVPVAQWETATPDQVYLESDAILTWSEGFRPEQIFNRFRIRDGGGDDFRDRIIFEADEDNGLAGSLFVFPNPFRDINVIDTSDAAITATPVGDVFLEKEDEVEFREGAGGVSFPVFSIQSVEWFDLDIGPVNFTLDSTDVTSSDPINKFSIALIKYTTRAKEFRTSSPVADVAQFLVEDC